MTVLLTLIALISAVQAIRIARGAWRLPRLGRAPRPPDADCPFVSILFTARDEQESLPGALESFLAQDYPRFEVIGVDDRSADATGRILDEAAARDPRIRAIHLAELPAGWLGKPHGLQKAYEASRGEWLVFTDADVRFAPDLLRRGAGMRKALGCDHFTLLGGAEMVGFWERVVISYFAMNLFISSQAWTVSRAGSRTYVGIGAFQMIGRRAYEAIGTHRRLAMEVLDDMKLGKLVKMGGLRSAAVASDDLLSVRWHAGLGNLIRGTTKNFFAAAGFNLPVVIGGMALGSLFSLVPFVALFTTSGLARAAALAACLIAVSLHAVFAAAIHAGWLYGFTHPLGFVMMLVMMSRSVWYTLRRGGIEWRGTFYPLEDLRKGAV